MKIFHYLGLMRHPYAQGLLQCNCAGLVSIIICRLVSNQLCRDCVIMGLVSGSRAIIENPGQSSCTEYRVRMYRQLQSTEQPPPFYCSFFLSKQSH